MTDGPLLLALVARVPPEGVADFQAYEAAVLPLLADHGGALERRLRKTDGTVEIHLVAFPSEAALAAFRADPRRAALAPLVERSDAVFELLQVEDVRTTD